MSTLTGQSRLAALAGQAQVERVAHLRRPPAVLDHLAVRHLEQQPRPSARRVLLLAGWPGSSGTSRRRRPRGTCRRRCSGGSPPKKPSASCANASVVPARRVGGADEHPQVVVQLRAGSTIRCGFIRPSRIPRRLELPERGEDLAAGTSGRAARRAPGRRRARRTASRRARRRGRPRPRGTGGTPPTPGLVSRSKSIRTCMQPSPKWP